MNDIITIDDYQDNAVVSSVTVYAQKKSASRTEFESASVHDVKPEYVFVVWTDEYNGGERIRYGEQVLYVYRTYERSDNKTELHATFQKGMQKSLL
jgi:head-tail adaptor